MISPHPSFTQPSDPKFHLWRYMDLSKFMALLQQERLYFARGDNLGDPFEGSLPKLSVEAWEHVAARWQTDGLVGFKAAGGEIIEFSKLSSLRQTIREWAYISCWHMNEFESAAMWRLYSQSSDAICIQTTFEALASALPPNVLAGTVEYIDYDSPSAAIPIGCFLAPFLRKRKSYEHEHEVRAILLRPNGSPPFAADDPCGAFSDGGVKVPIDLNSFIHNIFISPTAPGWFRTVVEEVAQRYRVVAPVKQSGLLATPLY
jgi:hypothetical protein